MEFVLEPYICSACFKRLLCVHLDIALYCNGTPKSKGVFSVKLNYSYVYRFTTIDEITAFQNGAKQDLR